MATYVGKATTGDTASLPRLIRLRNPKVTVLWRGTGLRDKLSSSDQASIAALPPFEFSLKLLQPPSQEVIDAPEITFGLLSLYSDEDRNGKFDRLVHPELSARYALLDSLSEAESDAKAALMEVAEVRARTPFEVRFYQEASGRLFRADGGAPDTLRAIDGLDADIDAHEYVKIHQRILFNQNRWEHFFSSRKKDNEYYYRTFPAPGFYVGYEVRFDRALFPKPGKEAHFEARVDRVIRTSIALYKVSEKIRAAAFLSGKMDYPFTGFASPGQDWMAGRAISDLLLFIRSQATLDSLLAAAHEGSFRFTHIGRLRPGYNLFRCDDQYNCDVRLPEDSISIYLGTTEAFFNAPATPSRNPFQQGTAGRPASPPPAAAFGPFQGRYALNGSDTVSIAVRNGELWCEATGPGLLRVLPMDSLGFQSPITAFQGLLTRGTPERPKDRFVQYIRNTRLVVMSLGEPVASGLLDRIDRASGFRRIQLPLSRMRLCEGKYDFKGDTLRVVHAGGDSLAVSIPGYATMAFLAVNDSLFQCPWGELSLEFQGAGSQGYRRVVFANGSSRKSAPLFGSIPSHLVGSGPKEGPGMEWENGNGGTGRDTYMDLEGGKRYSCSEDGVFLRPGDGFLAGFSRSGISDSISLRQAGDVATFRLPGMKGRMAYLELRNCAEKRIKSGRIRVSIWGGADPASQRLLYGDHQWMASASGGTYWSFDSLAIDADPYYLTLKQENTADAPFSNAFDGYRLGFRP